MIQTRICKTCKIRKKPDEFYKSNIWNCKDCIKKRARTRHEAKTKDPSWREAERQRHREKYHRLGYKEKQLEWDKDKPWKKSSTYKNLNRDLKLKHNEDAHHWSYQEENLKDIFILKSAKHKRAHRFLNFNKEKLCFQTNEGVLLDTKDKHKKFLEEINAI